MYTESATSMTNTGDINITDYSKNFTSNNAGGKWLDNKEYSRSNAEKLNRDWLPENQDQ